MITQDLISLSAKLTHELILKRFHPKRYEELLREKESALHAAEIDARLEAWIAEHKEKKPHAIHKPTQKTDTAGKPNKPAYEDSIANRFKNKKVR